MENKRVVTSSGGISFAGALAILFIGLKLTHNIDWAWVWVLSPLWAVFAIVFIIFLTGGIVTLLSVVTAAIIDKVRR